ENPAARAFLAEIAAGLAGNGFAYFDGLIDQSNKNELQFADALHDNDKLSDLYDAVSLGELYDNAWDHLRASRPSLSRLSGVTRAQADAADDVAHYATHPADLAKVIAALQAERDHAIAQEQAWSEQDYVKAQQHA